MLAYYYPKLSHERVFTKTNSIHPSTQSQLQKRRAQNAEAGGGSTCCCCSSANSYMTVAKVLGIVLFLLALIAAVIIPIAVLLGKTGQANTSSSSTWPVTAPKLLGIYYGWPSLVQGISGNLTAATAIFAQFDLIVFGDGLSVISHGDHANTQTIIGSLNALGKKTYGYIDLGVTTQNLSIAQMQTTVNDWAAMGVKGILWDDAGYDYGVSRIRQTTMISYCHSLNLGVLMNAWNPDDIFSGSPMVLDSRDIYLLESYLFTQGTYQNLTFWKAKADKCLNYSAQFGVAMACVATTTGRGIVGFGSTQEFSLAWFGAAMYDFDYFQAADDLYSSSSNFIYMFPNPISSYGTYWTMQNVQTGSSTYYYRSTDTSTLNIYGDGSTYGSGNLSSVLSG